MNNDIKKELNNLLANLIQIESPYFREHEAINFVCEWLNFNNLPAYIHHYVEKEITKFSGINAVGILEGGNIGPTVLLNGHIDTVDLCEGWTKPPFEAKICDNKMYGLGALDMKSGVAAMLLAIKHFSINYPNFNGKIKYQVVSDEEGPYGLGTNYLIEDGLCDADVAIIPEPSTAFLNSSQNTVCLGARGGLSYKIVVKGISAHAASPQNGVNAIVEASKLIVALKEITSLYDEKLGHGSTAIIKIDGGGAPASIADKTEISVFRHIVRNENAETVKKEVYMAATNANVNHDNIEVIFRKAPTKGCEAFLPYVCDEHDFYIKSFIDSVKQVSNIEPLIDYFPSIGDFNYIGSRLNIPTIVFGPKGSNYHSSDEYVELDSYYETFNVIYNYLVKILT